jgi:hypothetical protein
MDDVGNPPGLKQHSTHDPAWRFTRTISGGPLWHHPNSALEATLAASPHATSQ